MPRRGSIITVAILIFEQGGGRTMGGDDDDGEAPSFETQEGSSENLFHQVGDYCRVSDL